MRHEWKILDLEKNDSGPYVGELFGRNIFMDNHPSMSNKLFSDGWASDPGLIQRMVDSGWAPKFITAKCYHIVSKWNDWYPSTSIPRYFGKICGRDFYVADKVVSDKNINEYNIYTVGDLELYINKNPNNFYFGYDIKGWCKDYKDSPMLVTKNVLERILLRLYEQGSGSVDIELFNVSNPLNSILYNIAYRIFLRYSGYEFVGKIGEKFIYEIQDNGANLPLSDSNIYAYSDPWPEGVGAYTIAKDIKKFLHADHVLLHKSDVRTFDNDGYLDSKAQKLLNLGLKYEGHYDGKSFYKANDLCLRGFKEYHKKNISGWCCDYDGIDHIGDINNTINSHKNFTHFVIRDRHKNIFACLYNNKIKSVSKKDLLEKLASLKDENLALRDKLSDMTNIKTLDNFVKPENIKGEDGIWYIGEFLGRKVFWSEDPFNKVVVLEEILGESLTFQDKRYAGSSTGLCDHYLRNKDLSVILNDDAMVDVLESLNYDQIKFAENAKADEFFRLFGEIRVDDPEPVGVVAGAQIQVCENIKYETDFIKRQLETGVQCISNLYDELRLGARIIRVDKNIFKDWAAGHCCTLKDLDSSGFAGALDSLDCYWLIKEEYVGKYNGVDIYVHKDPVNRLSHLRLHNLIPDGAAVIDAPDTVSIYFGNEAELWSYLGSADKAIISPKCFDKMNKWWLWGTDVAGVRPNEKQKVVSTLKDKERKESKVSEDIKFAGFIPNYEINLYLNVSDSPIEYLADETGMAYLAVDELAEYGKVNNFLETFSGHKIIVTPTVLDKIMKNLDILFERSHDLDMEMVDELISDQKYKIPERVTLKQASKKTFGGVSGAFKSGAKMAAATEFNQMLVDMAKFALKEFNTPEDILDHKAADAILHLFTPFALLMMTEYLPEGTLPGEKYLKAGAEVAVSAETMRIMMPIMAQIRPKIKEIVSMAKDASGEIDDVHDDDFESDLEEIFASEQAEKEPVLVE